MAEKIAVTNNTNSMWFVAGAMVPPGETRHFDAEQVPEHMRPAPPAEAPVVVEETTTDPVSDMLAHPIKEIMELVPAMSLAEVRALREAEAARDTPRATLLSLLDKDLLERASGDDSGQGDGAGA